MNRIQKISFSDVQEFLNYLPKKELILVQSLRSIILDCMPNPIEKLRYNVPYYYQHSSVCFIWPASIPWGKVQKNGVMLGFPKGYLMRDEIGFFKTDERKHVRSRTFHHIKEIDSDLIKTYIFEAWQVDEINHL